MPFSSKPPSDVCRARKDVIRANAHLLSKVTHSAPLQVGAKHHSSITAAQDSEVNFAMCKSSCITVSDVCFRSAALEGDGHNNSCCLLCNLDHTVYGSIKVRSRVADVLQSDFHTLQNPLLV